MKPRVYDRNMNELGTLEHAMNVSFAHVFNDLWQAGLSLPVRDEENALCQGVHTIVDIPDGNRSAGKYRISGEPETELREHESVHSYTLEHVLAFLLDDRIHGYLELGGSGITRASAGDMLWAPLISQHSAKISSSAFSFSLNRIHCG